MKFLVICSKNGKDSCILDMRIWARADQIPAYEPCRLLTYKPGSMLPLLTARPTVTFPSTERRHLADTILYSLVTVACV